MNHKWNRIVEIGGFYFIIFTNILSSLNTYYTNKKYLYT